MKWTDSVFDILYSVVLILIGEFYATPLVDTWENELLVHYFSMLAYLKGFCFVGDLVYGRVPAGKGHNAVTWGRFKYGCFR